MRAHYFSSYYTQRTLFKTGQIRTLASTARKETCEDSLFTTATYIAPLSSTLRICYNTYANVRVVRTTASDNGQEQR